MQRDEVKVYLPVMDEINDVLARHEVGSVDGERLLMYIVGVSIALRSDRAESAINDAITDRSKSGSERDKKVKSRITDLASSMDEVVTSLKAGYVTASTDLRALRPKKNGKP